MCVPYKLRKVMNLIFINHNSFSISMLGAGLEPARHCWQGILSLPESTLH